MIWKVHKWVKISKKSLKNCSKLYVPKCFSKRQKFFQNADIWNFEGFCDSEHFLGKFGIIEVEYELTLIWDLITKLVFT